MLLSWHRSDGRKSLCLALLTETTLYANHTLAIPLYILLLDKQAAFDSV